MTTMPDIIVNDCGTIVQLTPTSDAGRSWVNENVQSEGWQWLGRALCIDHRYAADIVSGAQDAGLEVSSC